MSVRDQVVLITGATSPLGRGLTDAFAAAGARLALVVRRMDAVHRLRGELSDRGIGAFVVPCDVRYEEDVVRMVHRVARHFGRIDTAINAAAVVGPRQRIEDYPVDPWRKVMATNVTGAYLVSREVLPWMIRQERGVIINITSSLPAAPRPQWGAYLVSNHAIEGLTRLLALESKSSSVRVNVVDIGPPRIDEKPLADGRSDLETFLWLSDDACTVTGQRIRAADGCRVITQP